MYSAAHHQHKRKRKKSNDAKIKLLDKLVTVISFVFPLSALPQIYNIWVLKNVQGVSLLTWFLFLLMQIPLFIYASVHKENRLKVMFGLWCTVYLFALVGLVMYQ